MASLNTTPIASVTALNSVWPAVRNGLEAILRKSQDDWTPEDVYHALRCGAMQLVVGLDAAGAVYGFFITQLNTDLHGAKSLHIFAAYNTGGHAVIGDMWPHIHAYANAAGCAKITALSSRKGFARALGKATGMQAKAVIYEINLTQRGA